MAEERNRHIIDMEKSALAESVKDQSRGMYIGGFVFASLVISALIVALKTESAMLAGVFLGTAAAGVVGLFIKGRNGKQ